MQMKLSEGLSVRYSAESTQDRLQTHEFTDYYGHTTRGSKKPDQEIFLINTKRNMSLLYCCFAN